MAIDPNIVLQAGKGVPSSVNLLALGEQAQKLQYNRLALRQQQLDLAATQARGRDTQASIGKDGTFDPSVYRAKIASDPDAAYGAEDAVSTSQTQQNNNLMNEYAQIRNQSLKAGMIAGLAAPLLSDPTVSKDDVRKTLEHGIRTGLFDTKTAQAVYDGMPNTSDGIRKNVRGLMDSTMPAAGQAADAFGENQLIDDGGQLRVVNRQSAGAGGQITETGAPISKTITPEGAATQQSYTDANGTPQQTTMGNVLSQEGAGNLVPQQARPTVPPEVMGSGRYPGAAQPAQQGPQDFSGGGASTQPQQQPGSFQTGPAAGQVQAQVAQAAASAQGLNALMQAAANHNDRLGVLANMEGDLEQFNSGPGYERLRRAQSLLNNYAGTSWNEGGIEASQSFNKFAAQLVQAQSAALGVGTDAKLASAEHANPNSALQTGTNRQMLHVLMGNEDAINAKAQAWSQAQKQGVPASQFQQWNQQFSQTFDPRAYQMLRMSPEERAKMLKAMKSSGQLDQFKASVNAMGAAGLLPGG